MFDFNYTPENSFLVSYGYPDTNKEDQFGMLKGWTIRNNKLDVQIDNVPFYDSEHYYTNSRIRPMHYPPGIYVNIDATAMKIYGLTPPKEEFDLSDPQGNMRATVYENISPYTVAEFPATAVYFDAQTNDRLADLSKVINDVVQIRFAEFVTGARPLTELNNYFAELDRLGYQEYLKYYVDYYEKLKAAK
jgi:hypothetical protein